MSTLPPDSTPLHACWTENDEARKAWWPAGLQGGVPRRIIVADDTLSADDAYRLISQGTSLLWRGDFQNARQLLQALARRIDKKQAAGKKKRGKDETPASLPDAFNRHRLHQSQRTDLLNRLLIELDAEAAIVLRRAPIVKEACAEALELPGEPFLLALRALQGIIGAHEWRKKGVTIPGLAQAIHVHYGVYSPNRGEYLDLLAQAPLPGNALAFDIGTGSGVIAAMLAQRGVRRVVATDMDERALACARENMDILGFSRIVQVQKADLFPEGRSPLIVCNPPWLPARPTTPIEHAIYDPGSRMLLGYLNGLADHLEPDGEGWLIMSDLAEHLGLRSPDFLPQAIADAGLRVIDRLETRPRHPKALDASDPLHAARRAEMTSLWRLAAAK
ncbi:MAG: class I SAM-dependent methyltransferase [Burkholderiaceae bacterium]